jgi:putative ABC transport system permease protein
LGLKDSLRVAGVGLRARQPRAARSALGIAIGTAAIVAVLGLSSSSQAGLLAEIDRLGTNMLTVEVGQSFTGQEAQLPREAPARITHLDFVQLVTDTAPLKEREVYRNPMIPVGNTGGVQVRATRLNLLFVLGTDVARQLAQPSPASAPQTWPGNCMFVSAHVELADFDLRSVDDDRCGRHSREAHSLLGGIP